MSKLTARESAAHKAACKLLEKDTLTMSEREFVLDNWHEAAQHMNGEAGAFFTPESLARELAIEVGEGSTIDLCAGIGRLAFQVYHRHFRPGTARRFVCVDINPAYVAVGRKVLPEAEWICGDVFDLPADLGSFDYAIGNPPFGAVRRQSGGPRYTGRRFEYHVIDVASDLARFGAFILPQGSCPFAYSGRQTYEQKTDAEYGRFAQVTGVTLEMNCGIDTSASAKDWRFPVPVVEIACVDFTEARAQRQAKAAPIAAQASRPIVPPMVGGEQFDLFAVAQRAA